MFPPFDAGIFTAIVVMVAAADSVPAFNVEPFCHAVAMRAAPVGDKDVCLRQEREARDQLVRQWTRFPVADRSYCEQLARTGSDPTYTELLTCEGTRETCGRENAGRWGKDRNNNVECIHWANR